MNYFVYYSIFCHIESSNDLQSFNRPNFFLFIEKAKN